MEDEAVIAELVQSGHGRWTAEMFLIFACCAPMLPLDDLGCSVPSV